MGNSSLIPRQGFALGGVAGAQVIDKADVSAPP